MSACCMCQFPYGKCYQHSIFIVRNDVGERLKVCDEGHHVTAAIKKLMETSKLVIPSVVVNYEGPCG